MDDHQRYGMSFAFNIGENENNNPLQRMDLFWLILNHKESKLDAYNGYGQLS